MFSFATSKGLETTVLAVEAKADANNTYYCFREYYGIFITL